MVPAQLLTEADSLDVSDSVEQEVSGRRDTREALQVSDGEVLDPRGSGSGRELALAGRGSSEQLLGDKLSPDCTITGDVRSMISSTDGLRETTGGMLVTDSPFLRRLLERGREERPDSSEESR